MLAPQDQRTSPQTPAIVYLLPGDTLNCEVESATDIDHWTKSQNGTVVDSGAESEGLSFSWSSVAGTFADATRQKTTWTAPQTPGTYILIYKFNDLPDVPPAPTGVTAPETGNRNDLSLARGVAVIVAYPTIKVSFDTPQNAICAGGWSQGFNNGAGGYGYLSKEKSDAKDPNPWVARGARPDPHITTATIKASWPDGTLFKKVDVKVSWDMPGPAPAESKTITIDDNGHAQLDIISGDEVSQDTFADKPSQSFNTPVEVKAECLGGTGIGKLNVLAPFIEWQYKNEQGNYVTWDGNIKGLYSDERLNIPLRAVLTFNNKSVVGHHISWGLDAVYDKAGTEVPSSDGTYKTYGQLSGTISTTDASGGATATFHCGYSLGQLVFAIEDSSTYTYNQDASPFSPSPRNLFIGTPTAPTTALQTRKPKKRKKLTLAFNYYDYAGNIRTTSAVYDANGDAKATVGGKRNKAYPAPGGEEDGELIPETLREAQDALKAPSGITSEWSSGRRNPRDGYIPSEQSDIHDTPSLNDPSLYNYYWWFSQVIGQDPASAGTHFADFSAVKGGKTYLYGAAFDIVLWQTPVFKKHGNKPRTEFQPFVRKLRKKGFVAWHRWAGEYNPSSSYTAAKPASDENEIHCIDPLTPNVKSALNSQIAGFQRGWSNKVESSGYLIDFKIDQPPYAGETAAVASRLAKRSMDFPRYAGQPDKSDCS